MKLDDLPYEPSCTLLPAEITSAGVVEKLKAYDYTIGNEGRWRIIVDCEGNFVALVKSEAAEGIQKVLNEGFEEAYEVRLREKE